MWPMYVDYSDDECKRVLRSLGMYTILMFL